MGASHPPGVPSFGMSRRSSLDSAHLSHVAPRSVVETMPALNDADVPTFCSRWAVFTITEGAAGAGGSDQPPKFASRGSETKSKHAPQSTPVIFESAEVATSRLASMKKPSQQTLFGQVSP